MLKIKSKMLSLSPFTCVQIFQTIPPLNAPYIAILILNLSFHM